MSAAERYYERGEEEFGRFVNFTDAIFAIAMTILVVGVTVPQVSPDQLGAALGDRVSEITSFFVSFAVLGFYWLANHRFLGGLRRTERGLLVLMLVYLACIAFIPFPTALVGSYEQEPVTVVIYACTLGAASLLETLMLLRAHQKDCFRAPVPVDVLRYNTVASLVPVFVFAVSIPIAIWIGSTWALLSWLFLNVLAQQVLLRRFRPEGADSYL